MIKLKRNIATNRGRNVPSTDNDLRNQQVTQTSPGDSNRLPMSSPPWRPVTSTGRDLLESNEYTQEHPRLASRNDSAVPEPDVSLVTQAYAQPGGTSGSDFEAQDSKAHTKGHCRPKLPGPTCDAHVMTYAIVVQQQGVLTGNMNTWQPPAHASSRRRGLVQDMNNTKTRQVRLPFVSRDWRIDGGMRGIHIWPGPHVTRPSAAENDRSSRSRPRSDEIERQGSMLVGRHASATVFPRSLPRDLQVASTTWRGKNKGKQRWTWQPGRRHGPGNGPKRG